MIIKVGLSHSAIDKAPSPNFEALNVGGNWTAKQISLQELADHIAQGFPWMPSTLDKGAGRRWQNLCNEASVLALDIDSGLTIEQAMLDPFIQQHCCLGIPSASHKPDHHKFRLVFALDKPLVGFHNIKAAYVYLQEIFKQSDKSCKDSSRFFYGAKGKTFFLLNESATLGSDFADSVKQFQDKQELELLAARIKSEQYRLDRLANGSDDTERNIDLALDAIDPDCEYSEWLAIGMALHSLGDEYLNLWDSWSAGGSKYQSGVCERKWRGFRSGTVSIGSLFHIAKQHGFNFPAKKIAKNYEPSLTINQKLLDVPRPKSGLTGLEAGMGAGKTKQVQKWLKDEPKVLSLSHLLSLAEVLSKKLDANFLNKDFDSSTHCGKTIYMVKQQPVSESEYRAALAGRLTLCVQSAMKLDPKSYQGSTIFLDEVDQLFSTLLTDEKTCNREGYRPLLLATMAELISNLVSKQVIFASAHISDALINLLERLRGEKAYLIRNTHVADRGDLTMLESENMAFLAIARAVKAGKNLHIPCDSIAVTKKVKQFLLNLGAVENEIMLINSDTSKGARCVDFINDINIEAPQIRYLISSPTLNTGASIEVDHFDLVIGLFSGVIKHTDIAQALARVRKSVPRLVYISKKGQNLSFWKYSRSTDPDEIRSILKSNADQEIKLLKNSVRAAESEMIESLWAFDDNPYIDYFCEIIAARNASLSALRENAKALFIAEGYTIVEPIELTAEDKADVAIAKEGKKEAGDAVKEVERESIASAVILSDVELKQAEIDQQRNPTKDLQARITASYSARFYALEVGTGETLPENVLAIDPDGKLQGAIRELEYLLDPEWAALKDRSAMQNQNKYGKGIWVEDQPMHLLRSNARQVLKLGELFAEITSDPTRLWKSKDFEKYTKVWRKPKVVDAIKERLGLQIQSDEEKCSNFWLVKALLQSLGIKFDLETKGKNRKQRFLKINIPQWNFINEVIDRRSSKVAEQKAKISERLDPTWLDELPTVMTVLKGAGGRLYNNDPLPHAPLQPKVELLPHTPLLQSVAIEVMSALVESVESVERVELVEQVEIEQPQTHKTIPFSPKAGMAVLHKGFQCVIKRVGTASAKIASIDTDYDFGYVDFADLQVA